MINSFTGQCSFLSNFYGVYVEYEGQMYPTVEAGFQAAKTLNPNLRTIIRFCKTPQVAKFMGRKLTLRPDWELIKMDVMLGLLRYKFRDPSMKHLLLKTNDHELVEGNYWCDLYWGQCGTGVACRKGIHHGEGDNWLGTLLQLVRQEIRHA